MLEDMAWLQGDGVLPTMLRALAVYLFALAAVRLGSSARW
jgi:hypothetical protein